MKHLNFFNCFDVVRTELPTLWKQQFICVFALIKVACTQLVINPVSLSARLKVTCDEDRTPGGRSLLTSWRCGLLGLEGKTSNEQSRVVRSSATAPFYK